MAEVPQESKARGEMEAKMISVITLINASKQKKNSSKMTTMKLQTLSVQKSNA